jgi:hypothetical protein
VLIYRRKKVNSMSKIDLILQESEKAFLAESERGKTLTEKAEKYIAAIGLVVGFQLININRSYLWSSWQSAISSSLAIVAFLTLGFSLVLALLSRRVYKYYSYPRGTTIIDELKNNEITDEAAKIKVAKMYFEAHDKNAEINDKRAKYLSIVGVLIVLGFVLAVASYAISKLGI